MKNQVIRRKRNELSDYELDRRRWKREDDQSRASMEITRECVAVWRFEKVRLSKDLDMAGALKKFEAFIVEAARQETRSPVEIEFDREAGTVAMIINENRIVL